MSYFTRFSLFVVIGGKETAGASCVPAGVAVLASGFEVYIRYCIFVTTGRHCPRCLIPALSQDTH
jgi:hypothetical protein